MTLVDAPARVDLSVEAGGTVETTFEVATTGDLRLLGMPDNWYDLSVRTVQEHARVLLVVHPPRLEHGGHPGLYDLEVEGVEAVPSRWRVRVVAPGGTGARSDLLDYLPRHYRADPFLARFLMIFQAALDPIEEAIDNTHLLFDAGLTPATLLEWLAGWLDLDLSSTPDEATRRVLIERAVELYRWKGTRRGLRTELAIRLRSRALIVENFDGLRLGHDAALGLNTQLGRRLDNSFVITLGGSPDLERADALVDAARPAGCSYVLRLAPTSHGHAEVVDHG